jgi:hypothetical protein
LERSLLEAAQAVEAQKGFLDRQSRAEARHKEIMALKKAEAEGRAKESGERSPLPPPIPNVRENPSAEGSPPRWGRGLPGLGAQGRPNGGSTTPPPHPTTHSPHFYGYERAKRAVEASTRAIETARRDLENACR